ncbi:Z1 domain-containing protein [Actinopolymorpha sp. B9G3]|uniref:Z1 domain-containing protein n=1 Tax=Actinopolymorpha sp. B9G3 TaxID=3158970 RepID=UPI0032D92FCA
MTDATPAVLRALKSLEGEAPEPLLDEVNRYLTRSATPQIDESALVDILTTDDLNAAARVRFQILISRWNGATDEKWVAATVPHSAMRRALIHELLEFGHDARSRLDAAFPRDPGAIVIEGDGGAWKPWYDAARQAERDFYWKAYSGLLEADPGWDCGAIARLDGATTSVVRRLADPAWPERYQSKGLVVGYVQSGKTANFTGVIAKAIDAGYRLIIVLTGTVEILRRQTQRRLDMELVGVENILGGIDENNADQVATTDYHTDQDWIGGKFLRHGVPIHNLDHVPTIRRLSTFKGEYRRLKQGLSTLDFRAGHELADRGRPLYDPVNLFRSDVRIAVVKKNSTVLKRLVDDLSEIRAELGEIPTLIVDDEADLASVNTKKQKTQTPEEKERTAVNRRIADMLGLLTRAQYVGYTATPFANVFVDPDDSEDIFPRDFIVSLERPVDYMGARDFHDLDADFGGEPKTIDNSNEKAYVRDLVAVDDADKRRPEIQKALDSFVLTGALKLFRRDTEHKFRHHTMLVHESVKQAEHAALAEEIREIWRRSGYDTGVGLTRLHDLYETDFAPVTAALHRRSTSAARREGTPSPPTPSMPPAFDALRVGNWIGRALDLIDRGTSPVIVVNGAAEKDYTQDALDFQGDDVWKILVGGAKLSRGFTVEGLTVSYYTRRTLQADSLMQMGRWFGFRKGYSDLVRLFIGRNVPAPRNQLVDLYEAFEAVIRDEEDFREELERYAAINEETGHPQITPEDVPPMVFQQVPWLKPTATNKMYNAELTQEGIGGKLRDFSRQPERGDGSTNANHFELIAPLLDSLTDTGTFRYCDVNNKQVTYEARYGIVSAESVCDTLAGFRWMPNYTFIPTLTFMREAINAGSLTDFAVLLPNLAGGSQQTIGSRADRLQILTRTRRTDGTRGGFSGSSPRQRPAIETIAGKRAGGVPLTSGGPLAVELRRPTRGALLLTLALDTADQKARASTLPPGTTIATKDIASLFSLALPYDCAPSGRIGFRTRKSDAGAIVDRDDAV